MLRRVIPFFVRRSRVELPHHFWHYLLRVARLPISPPALKSGTKIRNIFLISGIFLEKLLKVIFEDSWNRLNQHFCIEDIFPLVDEDGNLGCGIVNDDIGIPQGRF